MSIQNGQIAPGRHSTQRHREIPKFLSEELKRIRAAYDPQRENATSWIDADHARNLIYLGTYFPRTVIESWNVFHELFSIPVIGEAFRQKNVIRMLDIGSGTGGAVIGLLLALHDSAWPGQKVEVTSLDANKDALAKQEEMIEAVRSSLDLRIELVDRQRKRYFPHDRKLFATEFSELVDTSGRHDLVTYWKCLSELYNVDFGAAQGIIGDAIDRTSRVLDSTGICVIADVTIPSLDGAKPDRKSEFFSVTLNREANKHDRCEHDPLNAQVRTILPLPCGKCSARCKRVDCFTQRSFQVSHQLSRDDKTKIAYRVLALEGFARSVTASFANHEAYRVNSSHPDQACSNGLRRDVGVDVPCGYTGFFAEGN